MTPDKHCTSVTDRAPLILRTLDNGVRVLVQVRAGIPREGLEEVSLGGNYILAQDPLLLRPDVESRDNAAVVTPPSMEETLGLSPSGRAHQFEAVVYTASLFNPSRYLCIIWYHLHLGS